MTWLKRMRRSTVGTAVAAVSTFLLCLSGSSAIAQIPDWGPTISEQQVYDNPDDHELNLRYAQQQIQMGEMLNAGSALERMLYENPNWHSARLLYSAVLYRLDDRKAALRELTLLDGRELNADQISTLKQFKEEFQTPLNIPIRTRETAGTAEGRKTPTVSASAPVKAAFTAPYPISSRNYSARARPTDTVSGQMILGAAADNNAGNAFTDQTFGFSDKGDVSAFVGGRVQLYVPVSQDKRVALRARANAVIRSHETFSRADYSIVDLSAGIAVKNGEGRLAANIDARSLAISGETYLQQIGPHISYTQPVSEKTRATVSLSAYSQDYEPLSFAAAEDERDGIKTSLQLGLSTKTKPHQRLTGVIGFDTKTADRNTFAYKGPIAAVGFRHTFETDVYVTSQVRFRKLDYRKDGFSAEKKRSETRFNTRAAIGTPITKKPSPYLGNIPIVEVGINYNRRNSNANVNDYRNIGADIRLTLEF